MILLIILLLSYIYTNYSLWSIVLFLFLSILTIDSFCNTINIFRILGMYSIFIYLIAPLVGYHYFDLTNAISKLWVMYMPIESSAYFGYIFPSIVFFIIGTEILYNEKLVQYSLSQLGPSLKSLQNSKTYQYLLVVGLFALNIVDYSPQVLKFILYIIFLLFFPGILYLYFKPSLNNKDISILILAIGWIFFSAVKSTMFTIVAYMGMSISSFVFLKITLPFTKKFFLFVILAILMINLQFTKMFIRNAVYYKTEKLSSTLFIKTYIRNFYTIGTNFQPDLLFPIYVRVNQGRLTAYVLKNIPNKMPYDNGDRLFKTIFSSFIPRLFWPDKPEAGGKFNMTYYANLKTEKASMNVGPLGEAYGAFGRKGGIFFMFLYGLTLSFIFKLLIKQAIRKPLLILWIPIIFFQAIYSMETDVMQALNSIIKVSFFLWILFKIFPSLLDPKPRFVSF